MKVSNRINELARRYEAAARGAQRASAYPLLLDWGRHYLAEHFRQPSSPMHRWLETRLAEAGQARGGRVNLIGPRGHAKSTVATLAYVLKCAIEGREPYIWIVSDTKEQAQLHLENVKRELVDNVRLAADYPLAVGQGRRWQRHAIELANGVVIEAWSTGQRIRGRRRRAHRPTLIVCDDLQNDSHISSAAQRDASRQWFHGTLLKAGTKRTNIVNLATALHRDALAMQLHVAAGWTSERFAAIATWPANTDLWLEWEGIYTQVSEPSTQVTQADKSDKETRRGGDKETSQVDANRRHHDLSLSPCLPDSLSSSPKAAARAFYEAHRADMEAGAKVLWPAEEDLYTLMQMRVESGHTAFEREKQGSPVDPELCEWPESYFEDHIWFDRWPSELTIKTIALDPSKGQDSRRGDYSAYVMLGIDPKGVIYVEADLARRPTPQIVADGAVWCERFRPLAFGVEANQFQELLAGEISAEFRRRGVQHLVPALIHNQVNKQVRIRRLGPCLSQRRLRFLAHSASTRLLVDQLRDFPAGAHDDGPDALEMALRLAEEVWQGRRSGDGLGNRLIRD